MTTAFLSSCNAEVENIMYHLHTLMCSVSVVFIHTMEDDQRLNTLVHEGDTLQFSLQHSKKPESTYHVYCGCQGNLLPTQCVPFSSAVGSCHGSNHPVFMSAYYQPDHSSTDQGV